MGSNYQPKYVPPHKRRQSFFGNGHHHRPSETLEPPAVFEIPEVWSAMERQIYAGSQVFQQLMLAKRRYGADPRVEMDFQAKRKQSSASNAGVGTRLGTTFRDQFMTAMGDINEQVGGTLGAPIRDFPSSSDETKPMGFRRFIDLGCAPGGFSKWMLDHNPLGKGLGVTLSLEDHGLGFTNNDWDRSTKARYHVLEADLTSSTEQIVGHFGEGACDLVIAGAVYRDEWTVNPQPRLGEAGVTGEVGELKKGDKPASPTFKGKYKGARQILSLSQFFVALASLQPGGTLIMVSSLKPMPYDVALLQLLRSLFETVRPTKGKQLHLIRSSYYLVCQGLKLDRPRSGLLRGELLTRILSAIKLVKDAGLAKEAGEDVDMDWEQVLVPSEDSNTVRAKGRLLVEDELRFVLEHFEPMWTRQTEALERSLKGVRRGSIF